MTQPRIVHREAQPCAGIRQAITMTTFGLVVDRLGELAAWLTAQGVEPAGAPFIRYHVIDMDSELVVEAGLPLREPLDGSGDVVVGVLPAGDYATVTHVGHPDELVAATGDLLAWAARAGLAFDRWDLPQGEGWGCRLETYLTDPDDEPDLRRWETELAFRLADPQP